MYFVIFAKKRDYLKHMKLSNNEFLLIVVIVVFNVSVIGVTQEWKGNISNRSQNCFGESFSFDHKPLRCDYNDTC